MVVSVVEQSSTRASSATTHGNRWMLTPSSMQQEDQTVMIEQHQHCWRCDRPQTAASRLTEPHPPNVGTHPHRAGGSISPRMARVPPGITPHRSPRMAYSQSPRIATLASFRSQRSRVLEGAVEAGGERWVVSAMLERERQATLDSIGQTGGSSSHMQTGLGPSPLHQLLEVNAALTRNQAKAADLVSRLEQDKARLERTVEELRSELSKSTQTVAEMRLRLTTQEAQLKEKKEHAQLEGQGRTGSSYKRRGPPCPLCGIRNS